MRLGALIPIGFLIGALVCVLFLRRPPHDIAVDLAQPLVVVTYWQHFGALMWLALFIAVAVASIGYLRMLRRPPPLAATILLSALSCAAALTFPVIFSSDVYAYAGYGDMLRYGMNPYGYARITARDPLLDAMQWQWGNPPPMCVYGPAFLWIAQAIVIALQSFGPAAPLWALRVLACAALVACAPLSYAAFSRYPLKMRAIAAAGIALNPVAIWSCAEGHNDAMMIAIILAGFALIRRSRATLGAALVALSALLKAPGVFAAIGLTIASWSDRSRFSRIATGALVGIAISAILGFPLIEVLRAHLPQSGHYAPQFSLQGALALALPLPLTLALVFCACAATFAFGVRKLLAGDRSGALFMAFAVWLALPNAYPWYAIWILPVAFLAWDSGAAWAIVAASLLWVFRYYPDATTDLSASATLAIIACELALPIALFTVRRGRVRPDLPEIHTPVPDFAQLHSR
jgi:hypothetical protein